MEPLFDPTRIKTQAQVLAEFEAADSIEDWIQAEVADFFANDDDSAEDRLTMADEILEVNDEAFDAFVEDQYMEHDLVSYTLAITNHDKALTTMSAFKHLPNPTTLLWLCCQTASVGDLIRVTHSFANGHEVVFGAVWPFGMHEAVMMTTPDPEAVAVAAEDDERVHCHDDDFRDDGHYFDDEDDYFDEVEGLPGVVLRMLRRFGATRSALLVLGTVGAIGLFQGLLIGAALRGGRRG